jgi:hypothetical protein
MVVVLLILIVGFISPVVAQDSNVQIKKTEDRTGAVIPTPSAPQKTPDNNVVDRFFSGFETGIMAVVEPTSYWTGKGVDVLSTGVEKTGSFIFSRGFQAVDFKNKFKKESKETN